MKVIKPSPVIASSIVSSNLQESETAWVSTTSYQEGSVVVDDYEGFTGIFQALTANTNKKPENNPLDWVYVRPSNYWAMFDQQINTVSSAQQSIDIRVKTGNMQAIALLNLVGTEVTVTVTDGLNGAVIYTNTQSLIGNVLDWYQYFFFDIDTQRNQAIFVDLPINYIDTYTRIQVTGVGTVSIGTCTFGKLITIGDSEYGFTSGITDYSVKQTNEFGDTIFVRRAFSKRMSGRVLINNAELNRVQRALYDLRGVPALWFATQNPNLEEALVVFGYYKDFQTDISYPNYSYCSLDIEGLI
jgi:hypothetical protein